MERREHRNKTPGVTGEMAIQFDIVTGKVRSHGSGFWSLEQVQAFFQDWRQATQRIHANGRSVSALVDMSDGAVQTGEVADFIANATVDLYRPGDAIAMLVPNSLAKMQMRRVLDARFHDFFISANAAETWLRARDMCAGQSLPVGHIAA